MIISNNCVGAYCYKSFDKSRPTFEYDNPFIGCLILDDSFYKILKDFENLDFENVYYGTEIIPGFHINETEYNYVGLKNNTIKIFYRHYVFDNMILHWETRVPRMLKFMKDPNWRHKTIVSFSTYANKMRDLDQRLQYVYKHKIYKELRNKWKIVVSADEEFYEYDNIIYSPYVVKYEHTYDVSDWIYQNYTPYISNEWD